MPRPVAILSIAFLLTVALRAGPPAPQQAPAFRSSVEVVAVDFLAVDSQGRPLADLKASDLTLKVDGKPREVRSLQFVSVGKTGAPAASRPAASSLPVPFAESQDSVPVEAPGRTPRTVVFVVDHEHIRPGSSRIVPDIVGRFLDLMSDGDRAGLATMPNGRLDVDITPDLERVRRSAASVSGRTPAQAPSDDYNIGLTEAIALTETVDRRNDPRVQEIADFSCRLNRGTEYVNCMERTTAAVVAQAMQMARGAETSTHALTMSLLDFLNGLADVDGPKTLVFISEGFAPFQDTIQDFKKVTSAAGRSRVQLYAIQPSVISLQDASRSLMPRTFSQDLELKFSGLKDLAIATGGNLMRLSGTAENAVARIERETSAYYLLGFEPTPAERDGKSHTIEVGVQRRDVAVRARPEFTIPTAGRSNSLAGEKPAARDLPLRALAYPVRAADPASVKVVVVVESPDSSTRLSSLAFSLSDPSGQTIAAWTADGNQLSARPLLSASAVPPGDYRLHVAATDGRGGRGALDYSFSATLLPAGSLRTGGLMLGVARPEGAFTPKLLFGTSDDDVTGYFELYGVNSGDATVSWELAASIDGPALASAEGTVSPTADADRSIANGAMPVASLAPGDYVVRATVTLNGGVVGRLSRVLRKR